MNELKQDASSNEDNSVTTSHKKIPPFQTACYWLLALAVFYTLYFAKTLFLPIVVAALFSLLLSPLVSLFKRFYIPRVLSALLFLAMIGGPFLLLGIQLAEPVQKWGQRIPTLSAQLTDELNQFREKISSSQSQNQQSSSTSSTQDDKAFWQLSWFSNDASETKPKKSSNYDSAISERFMQGGVELVVQMLGATPAVLAQFLTFLILVIFMLVFGPMLYSNFISRFPQVHDKQAADTLVADIQKDLSRYILTVTVINTFLGIVTGFVLWAVGVEDALLWGVMVALLNFAPYVGPVIAMVILYLVGVMQYGPVLMALLPVLIFFSINLLEAQFITPTVLGRNISLNPLILILWLVLWGWIWGAVGVLIAVPLLVCLKLAAARLDVLTHWAKLIETPG